MFKYQRSTAWFERILPEIRATVCRHAATHAAQTIAALLERKRNALARRRRKPRGHLLRGEIAT